MDTGKAIIVTGALIALAIFFTNRYEIEASDGYIYVLDKVTGDACGYYLMKDVTKLGCTSDG